MNTKNMTRDFTKTIEVSQTPDQVYSSILNVRAWWSGFYEESITGETDKLNDQFTFRAGNGAHNTTQKIIELVPDKRVVWQITHSELTFLENKDEWTGTKIIFEITEKESKTQLRFTHQGLNPGIECYNACSSAWSLYIQQKLLPLITSIDSLSNGSFTTSISTNKPASVVYSAIKNFRGWWSEEIEGNTDKLNEIFFYHYKDIHLCKLKLVEAIPNTKLVYQVIENEFNFVKDKSEWVNTKLIFEISSEAGKTQVKFTHKGLVPDYECYQVCNEAWTGYIQQSLKSLIETGKGNPNPKDKDGFNAELARKWGLN